MKKMVLIFAIAGIFTACGNSSETSSGTDSADSTATSISPPPTTDSTSEMAPMMGDTSRVDSI